MNQVVLGEISEVDSVDEISDSTFCSVWSWCTVTKMFLLDL